ncbi:ParB/RepB/Spo0J family partition protein, partial [bacterium]
MRKGLGRGLAQLVGEQLEETPREVASTAIVPNARQPRRVFAEDKLNELADSIRVHGVLSPLLVRPIGDERYELIAGERRLRASRIAGLESVPVRIMAVRGQESLEIALIENVQRADIS